ncbi:MAG: DUF2752 domain-containing protein [Alphaproteobacteria bacterium]|nr:DUF2752 domain-containing protein [Alphaproteobacteria bacterium]
MLAPLRWFEGLSPTLQDRLVGLGLALPSGVVLAIARSLTPDPAGMGTHRQLGLGGCAFLTATGVPCPMCGMTTTFTHMAHLSPLTALGTQPFGVVLFLCTVGAFALGGADLLLPAGRWRRVVSWVDRREGWIAGLLLLGLILGWAYKIALQPEILSRLP